MRLEKPSRVQSAATIALTALFLCAIGFFGFKGVAKDPKAVLNAVRFHKAKRYLANEAQTDFFSMTQARILSLQDQLERAVPYQDELHVLNASFQYALGREMVVEGAEQMLRLPNGQLYYLTERKSLRAQAEGIVALRDALPQGTPLLFSYIHPGFFNGGQQLPEGYRGVDTSDELADEVLEIVRGAGIDALDSRTFFEGLGYTSDDLELKTDKHWTTLAALLATERYAREIQARTDATIDLSRLSLNAFDTETYPQFFFGDFGQLVGKRNAPMDDITVFLPKYDTHIARHSEHRTGDIEDVEGAFAEAVLRREKLTEELAYTDYGLIEAYETLDGEGGAEMTVLVLRDSYSAPICSFLSLAVNHVVSADLRYCEKTGLELIEEIQPDLVIVSFSRLMFEDATYRLGV
ncbi:MAG: hypothetical protein IJ234_01780 [Clostridia bacterium]|nr:hypothetical protein [Clostridia bacterium]